MERGDEVPALEAGSTGPSYAACRDPIVVLIPDDIFEACQEKELADVVRKVVGCPVREKIRFGRDLTEDEEVLQAVADTRKGHRASGLLIVQEAWQPPIREALRFIQELRRVSGEKTMLWVGLIGRPREGEMFTPPTPEDVQVWQQKLKALGDPYLGVERLASHEP